MNDIQHFEAARALAERLLSEGGTDPAERITLGYRLALGRRPSADELAVLQELQDKELARYQQQPQAAGQAMRSGESPLKAGELP